MVTYHAGAWVGDLSLEGDPLVVGPLFVSKGAQEGPPDVVHGVDAHGRAPEYTAAGTEREMDYMLYITLYSLSLKSQDRLQTQSRSFGVCTILLLFLLFQLCMCVQAKSGHHPHTPAPLSPLSDLEVEKTV